MGGSGHTCSFSEWVEMTLLSSSFGGGFDFADSCLSDSLAGVWVGEFEADLPLNFTPISGVVGVSRVPDRDFEIARRLVVVLVLGDSSGVILKKLVQWCIQGWVWSKLGQPSGAGSVGHCCWGGVVDDDG